MNCEFCNNSFNLSTRVPLILPCCGDTACKQCVMYLAGAPQQKFTCPAPHCREPNQDPNTFKTNKKLERSLKQAIGILCDKHPYSQGEFYCPTDNALVCTECAITTHQSHKCQKVEKQLLTNYNDKVLEFLRIELERIRIMISDVEGYQQNEKQFTSKQYLNIVNDVQTSLKPRMNQQQQNDIKFPLFKFNQQNKEEEKKQNTQKAQQPLPQQQNIIGSNLIKQDDYKLLKEYLNTDNLTLQLIYRGTDYGFTAETFHSRCDKRGPTMTVALSEHDQLFGGYTSVSWESPKKEYKQDSQAFLFQLTKKFKLTQYQNRDKAVCHDKKFGPIFGGGLDLAIGGINDFYYGMNFDKDNSCISSIYDITYRTYNLPLEIQNNKKEAEKYLAGSATFKLKEIEVFKVIFK